MRHRFAVSGCLALLLIVAAPMTALSAGGQAAPREDKYVAPPSAPAGITEAPGGHWAPYPDGGLISPLGVGSVITAGGCSYRQANDNPHISSTAPLAASVHGWWQCAGGSCPSKNNVDVYLQGYFCSVGCGWVTVASSSADVVAGTGGTLGRVTARRTCSSGGQQVGFRGLTDVGLIGISDPSASRPRQSSTSSVFRNGLDNPELRRGGGHLAIALPPCRNARDEKELALVRQPTDRRSSERRREASLGRDIGVEGRI